MGNETTLSVNLDNSNVPVDPYWLHMEVVEDSVNDGMTVAEAADIIDAIFNVTPCKQQDSNDLWQMGSSIGSENIWSDSLATQESAIETQDEEVANLEAKRRFADELLQYDSTLCGEGKGLILYTAEIKVFRSHRNELYKLQMSNGIAGIPSMHRDRVVHTIDVEDVKSYTFNNPIVADQIVDPPVIIWQGDSDGPKLNIDGNTVYWDVEYTGTLRAEFETEWDQLTISVTGEATDSEVVTGTDLSSYGTGWYSGTEDAIEITDNNNNQCTVLGFYHYQYEELILNEPEEDKSTTDVDKLNICNFVENTVVLGYSEQPDDDSEPKKCIQHVNETIVCQCDGREELHSYYEPAPCPASMSEGSTLSGSINRRTYSDCGDRDSVNRPEYYEEKCCVSWPFYGLDDGKPPFYPTEDMPWCKTSVRAYIGTKTKEYAESDYPDDTTFVTVAPVDGVCGEHTVEQVVNQENCCDEVPQISWNFEASAEVISDNSYAFVFVNGGKAPYFWKVRGAGFWVDVDHTERDIATTTSVLTVYTSASCGLCTIYVTDGCSSAAQQIASTEGQFVEKFQGCKQEWKIGPEGVSHLGFNGGGATGCGFWHGIKYSNWHFVRQWGEINYVNYGKCPGSGCRDCYSDSIPYYDCPRDIDFFLWDHKCWEYNAEMVFAGEGQICPTERSEDIVFENYCHTYYEPTSDKSCYVLRKNYSNNWPIEYKWEC